MDRTRQRIDKWLWFARIVKTRALASALVAAGQVRINRRKVTKPGQALGPDDVLTIILRGRVRVLKVLACANRRGPPQTAGGLYETSAMTELEGPASQKESASGGGTC